MVLFAVMAVLSTLLFCVSDMPIQAGLQSVCAARSKDFASDRAEAQRLEASGQPAEAVRQFRNAHRLCPDDYENSRDLAYAEIVAGDTDVAEALIQSLLQNGDKAELHSLMGMVLAAKKDYRNSAAQYQTAAKMEPTESNVFNFGTSLMKVNFGAATLILQYGLKSYPQSVKMHVALAVALYAQDRAEEGAKLLCQASELDPRDVHPMEVLADTGVVPRSVQPEAAKRLDKLRALYPNDGMILFDDAMVRSGRWSGDPSATPTWFAPMLHQALAMDPHLAKAYYQLALVAEQAKDYSAEISALKQAIGIDPGAEQFHYRLAFAYRASGDTANFQRELAKYTALHTKISGGD